MSLIVVQRGHVPRTSGATGAPGEQRFAIEAADRCAAHLAAVGHGCRVIDADPPSSSYYRGDAFVAIHYDSSLNPGVRGASAGFQTAEGGHIAHRWGAHYMQNGWTGGWRPDNYTANLAGYYGVRRAVEQGNRYAWIIEAGFHSNPDDAALLASPEGPDRVGISVAAAVVDFFGGGGCPPAEQPAGIPAYPGTVKRGDRGPRVLAWQRELNARVYGGGPHALSEDGVFGPATENVVNDFQAKHGLVVDGIAGPATWHALVVGG